MEESLGEWGARELQSETNLKRGLPTISGLPRTGLFKPPQTALSRHPTALRCGLVNGELGSGEPSTPLNDCARAQLPLTSPRPLRWALALESL